MQVEEKKQAAADVLFHYSKFVMACIGNQARPCDLRLHLMKVILIFLLNFPLKTISDNISVLFNIIQWSMLAGALANVAGNDLDIKIMKRLPRLIRINYLTDLGQVRNTRL